MNGPHAVIRFAAFLTYLDNESKLDELELSKHAFIPDCWCVKHTVSNRAIQLHQNEIGHPLEVDYLVPDEGATRRAVYTVTNVAERTLQFLRGETTRI